MRRRSRRRAASSPREGRSAVSVIAPPSVGARRQPAAPGPASAPVFRPDAHYASRMAFSRFRYSRWDGTQAGLELSADEVLGEITDDLLYHGDLNAALRRLMQSGFRTPDGERMQGIREMLENLRRK